MKKILCILLLVVIFSFPCITVNAQGLGSTQIVSNGNTTFLIQPDGTVKGWGRNTKGELGIGATDDVHSPVTIEGLSNIYEIIPASKVNEYFLAIDKEGNVFAWGDNGYGQLGIGSMTNQLTPAKVPNLPKTRKIILREFTVYALTYDGDVYAWGKNTYGQIGNGTTTNKTTPNKVGIISNVKELICEGQTVFALTESKQVYVWGRADDYQLGTGKGSLKQTSPVLISSLSNVDEVITNGTTSFAICNNRQEIYSWGEGWRGELGTYSERNRTPKRMWALSDLNETIEKVIIKQNTAFAITSDNTLYGWGNNSNCQLGTGVTYNQGVPVKITNIPKVNQFIFNGYSGIVLGTDNCVYAWGKNSYGEVGVGTTYSISSATKLGALGNDITQIYNGINAMYALNSNGEVYAWGTNTYGQLGIGTVGGVKSPTRIDSLLEVSSIKKNGETVFATDTEGIVYGWGVNSYGQLGDSTVINAAIPLTIFDAVMKTTSGSGDVISTVPIIGSINALEVSVTHPLNISYTINPNIEESFVCPNIQIRNNSKVPVKITIESFKASSDSVNKFEDVMPESLDWDTLSHSDTKKYIALGIDYVDETKWRISKDVMPLYVAEIDNNYIGALSSGDTVTLRLYCYHGLAFEGSFAAEHELVFVVSLL